MIVGTFEYLIGLQYSYENDRENMMKYFYPLHWKHCKGTPYEDNIHEIIEASLKSRFFYLKTVYVRSEEIQTFLNDVIYNTIDFRFMDVHE